MAQFQSQSIGIYLKDLRKLNRKSLTDKFSNDPKYISLFKAWEKAEQEYLLEPSNDAKIELELTRRGALEKYINSKGDQSELNSLPLVTNKGNRDKEIENCLMMVYSIALKYIKMSNPIVSFEDLLQYGNYGLVVAADKYFSTQVPDESIKRLRTKGFAKFSAYAYFWIKKYVIEGSHEMGTIFGGSAVTKEDANRNSKMVSLDSDDSKEIESINSFKGTEELKSVEDDIKQLSIYLKSVFAPLSKYEKKILFMALGIDTPNGVIYKMTEIADILGTSTPTISRDLAKCYNKLRTQANQELHGEDGVTMVSLLLGNDMNLVNLPEFRMESTITDSGSNGSKLLNSYRTDF